MIEVILKKDIPKLGKAGEVVKVKDGYARNYLIPKGLAILANQRTLKALENERKLILAKVEREKRKTQSLAEKLQGFTLTLYRKVVGEGRLYGSVTPGDLSKALVEKGFDIDRKQILLAEPIKTVGSYEVLIRLSSDITVPIKVEVIEER
ncbi:MAG: 50S ribosomal protein L9 [Caldimicrobium sp.]|nr:50S ribosomal protein L9 [Caldimicrobium sp.]MCX7874042.1 50S ribosomal protein L9 [Caldimicrobium sp.]MDW8093866.1 50S ribosomal protein L9 [Caldimicrobium sp.]